ncbi:MAG: imidazole glycerol phosphate synthase subunit HisH, partial [Planctomycetes bacterium]|nr:imidazole glycerol phosphate synthase subunit HisH [Planctomycetota bacterium]
MISIIDYGMGNLRSVQKAFEKLGASAEIISTPEKVERAEKLVLPGVGAFRDAIHELERLKLVDPIRKYVTEDRPFLGICLGLQLLFDVSYEEGTWPGLGLIPGEVVRFSQG